MIPKEEIKEINKSFVDEVLESSGLIKGFSEIIRVKAREVSFCDSLFSPPIDVVKEAAKLILERVYWGTH